MHKRIHGEARDMKGKRMQADIMQSDPETARLRIRRLARISQIVLTVAIAALALIVALALLVAAFAPEERALLFADLFETQDGAPRLDGAAAAAIVAISVAPSALVFYALAQARRLMGGYRRGDIFTATASGRLRRMGWAIFAMAPAAIVTQALAGLAFQAAALDSPAATALTLSIDDGNVAAIALGLFLVVLGRVLGEAQRLAAENEAFV